MAIPHAGPGIPMDIYREGDALTTSQSQALVKCKQFEAIRLVIPKEHQMCRNHQVEGPITVQCLRGEIAFTVDDESHSVRAGEWLFLPGGVRHSIKGVKDSVVLLTVMFA